MKWSKLGALTCALGLLVLPQALSADAQEQRTTSGTKPSSRVNPSKDRQTQDGQDHGSNTQVMIQREGSKHRTYYYYPDGGSYNQYYYPSDGYYYDNSGSYDGSYDGSYYYPSNGYYYYDSYPSGYSGYGGYGGYYHGGHGGYQGGHGGGGGGGHHHH